MTRHLSTNILEAYLPPTNIIGHFYLIGWETENRNFAGQTSKQKRCFYFLTQAAATVGHVSGGPAGEGVWVQSKRGVKINPWEVTVRDLTSIFREDFCFAGQREKRRDIVQKLIVNWWMTVTVPLRYSFDPLARVASSFTPPSGSYRPAVFTVRGHARHPRAHELWKVQGTWGLCWHLNLKKKMKLSQRSPEEKRREVELKSHTEYLEENHLYSGVFTVELTRCCPPRPVMWHLVPPRQAPRGTLVYTAASPNTPAMR